VHVEIGLQYVYAKKDGSTGNTDPDIINLELMFRNASQVIITEYEV